MSGKSPIEWTSLTWNPTSGCTRVSPGCDNCYAFTVHDMRHEAYKRYGGVYPKTGKPMPAQYAYPFSVIQMFESRLDWPLHVKTPNRVFVNSMSDLFHNKIDPSFRREVFAVMKRAHWHTFQILTKRGNGLQKLADKLEWSPNIWIGVSVENDLFTARVDQLRRVPAAVRFLSCEPLLGPLPSLNLEGIHWVITGGESGANARFCDPAWVRAIRDKCVSEGVAYFHKQWGGRTSKAGGRDLDGRTWDQFPEQPAQVANI